MGAHATSVKSTSNTSDKAGKPARRSQAVANILRAGVQPKLKIGAVNDPAEIEADRVADQVMRMAAPIAAAAPEAPPSKPNAAGPKMGPAIVQRKCAACDDEKVSRKEKPNSGFKPPVIRRHIDGGAAGGLTADAQTSSAINSLGSGSPLPTTERAFFEPRFGQDLSGVRIHTGGTADTAARAINARAFSLGNSIAFANGAYQPGTRSGRTLMAHEITHTLQGGGGVNRVVRRKCNKGKALQYYKGVGSKYKWSSSLLERLYRVVGPNFKSVYLLAEQSGKIDIHFVTLVCSAQEVIGFSGNDVDGKIGENTLRELIKWEANPENLFNWNSENIFHVEPAKIDNTYNVMADETYLEQRYGSFVPPKREKNPNIDYEKAIEYNKLKYTWSDSFFIALDNLAKGVHFPTGEIDEEFIDLVTDAQKQLGINTDSIDGMIGPETIKAYERYLIEQANKKYRGSISPELHTGAFWDGVWKGFLWEILFYFIGKLVEKVIQKIIVALSGAVLGVGVIITALVSLVLLLWDIANIAYDIYVAISKWDKIKSQLEQWYNELQEGTLLFNIMKDMEEFKDDLDGVEEDEYKYLLTIIWNELGDEVLTEIGSYIGAKGAGLVLKKSSLNKRKTLKFIIQKRKAKISKIIQNARRKMKRIGSSLSEGQNWVKTRLKMGNEIEIDQKTVNALAGLPEGTLDKLSTLPNRPKNKQVLLLASLPENTDKIEFTGEYSKDWKPIYKTKRNKSVEFTNAYNKNGEPIFQRQGKNRQCFSVDKLTGKQNPENLPDHLRTKRGANNVFYDPNKKRNRIANDLIGSVAEKTVKDIFEKKGFQVTDQIRYKAPITKNGQSKNVGRIVDLFGKDKNGQYWIIEVKYGNSPYKEQQKLADAAIVSGKSDLTTKAIEKLKAVGVNKDDATKGVKSMVIRLDEKYNIDKNTSDFGGFNF